MPYILQSAILGDIPRPLLTQALDEDADGVEDEGLWDVVAASAETEINGILSRRYAVPFLDPVPAIVTNACRVIILEKLYQRRGVSADLNPWTAAAKDARAQLQAIADGNGNLTATAKKVNPAGAVLSEPSGTYLNSGKQLA